MRIGCAFGSRNVTSCRVLQTQLFEVSELAVAPLDLRIRRSKVRILLDAPRSPASTYHDPDVR